MYGEWGIPGYEYAFLPIKLFMKLDRAPTVVPFKQVCAKPGDWFGRDDFSGERYEKADTSIPGMLVAGMPNPCGLPYRMIDGRRRMQKLREAGRVSGPFVVLNWLEIQPYIIPVVIDPEAPEKADLTIRLRLK